ncbi:MAG: hypothetical protein KTR23_08895 [Rhodospirillales bacterium]|nr:hypothetical protein [Rhodospirillales bacterium]
MTTIPDQEPPSDDALTPANPDQPDHASAPLTDFGLTSTDDPINDPAHDSSVADPAREASIDSNIVPATPDDYVLSLDAGLGAVDPQLNQRMHDAGFNNAQAQLVYDLAGEVLSPMMAEIDQVAQRASDRAALISEFGGAENWQKLAPKIESWGRANLPETAFDALCQTKDGVKALHRLMGLGQEATLGRSDGRNASGDIRAEIRRKMNDPRYWRDRDPGLIADVQAGFAKLREA